MNVLVAKVNEIIFQGDAYSITAPGSEGELTILGEHMPLVTVLKPGFVRIRVTKDAEVQEIETTGGVLEVTREGATVLL